MKKIALLLALLLAPLGALAQTSTMYRVADIAALKAIPTSRPPVVIVMDVPTGSMFEWGTTACAAADDYYQVTPTSGPAGCWTRFIPGFGPPISPPKPDTVQTYYSLTSTSGSANITVGGGSFTAADVGKLLVCDNIGSTEGRLITSIAAVGGPTAITTADVATRSVSAVSSRCMYGTDQATNLQTAFTRGKNLNVGSYVQGGVYLVSTGLTCLPPASNNGLRAPGPMCQLDPGAVIVAMDTMTSVITYGGVNGDYSEFLRNANFGGGTIDANFVADYAVDVPFYAVATRSNQLTKNAKLAGVRWGRTTAPQASGGGQDINVSHTRDILYVTVSSITNATTPVVTTAWDHGYATGRVVAFTGNSFSGGTPPPHDFYTITVTGPTTFTLNNTDSTSWGTFVSGRVALTMPSMRVPLFVSGITNAATAVVTVPYAHGYANDSLVWLADQTGINLGGIYCVKAATTFTFEIYESTCTTPIDTTSLGTYSASGTVVPYLAPTAVEKGIYYENGIDADVTVAQISGVRLGIYANPSYAGYDSKIIKPHFYNYNENGEMFAAVSMGGDNSFTDVQCDLPVRYCLQLSGPGNSSSGSRLTYLSGNTLVAYNNYASLVRLDGSGAIDVKGGGMKGDASYAVLGEVSVNGGSYGYTPGYSRDSVETRFTTLVQPDSGKSSTLKVMGYSGAASAQVSALGAATLYVYDRTASRGGMYISSGGAANTANFNTVDNTGAFVGTAFTIDGSTFRATNAVLTTPLVSGNTVVSTGSYIYATGGTGLVSAGIQFDGTGNAVGIYTANTYRGAVNSAGTIAWVGGGTFATLGVSGQFTSTLATGTAPFVVASTTNVANLNASSLNGATFAAPGAIGGGTPAAGAFTALSATTSITANGAAGLSKTYNFRAAGGAGDCTLITTFGIATGGSC